LHAIRITEQSKYQFCKIRSDKKDRKSNTTHITRFRTVGHILLRRCERVSRFAREALWPSETLGPPQLCSSEPILSPVHRPCCVPCWRLRCKEAGQRRSPPRCMPCWRPRRQGPRQERLCAARGAAGDVETWYMSSCLLAFMGSHSPSDTNIQEKLHQC
jgi:hypothetical protein